MRDNLKSVLDSLPHGTSEAEPHDISRRYFLGLALASAVVITPLGEVIALGSERNETSLQIIEDPPEPLLVVRADDLLVIEFFFVNLKLRSGQGIDVPQLVRDPAAPAAPAFLVAQFPPQHIAEELFDFSPGSEGQARTRISDQSRLVFRVPATVNAIDYTLKSLLEACLNPDYELNVPPAAIPAGQIPNPVPARRKPIDYAGAIAQNKPPESAIELPYRLVLAPVSGVKWEHSTEAETQLDSGSSITELWHTRMSGRTADRTPDALRAVWTRDDDALPVSGNPTFRMLPSATHRKEIVNATTDFSLTTKSGNIIRSERLMLSALGGWLKARYADDTPNASLAEWVQDTALGRDQYVKVVHRGFLYPYGHRATFLEIAERTYEPRVAGDQEENLVGYLRLHLYIVLTDFEKVYTLGDASSLPNAGRGLPFKSVRFTVERSPDITREEIPSVDTRFACWPMLNGIPYGFPLSAVDHNEQTHLFDSPVIFVAVDIPPDKFRLVVENYRTKTDPATSAQLGGLRSAVRMRSQKVAFAPSLPRAAGEDIKDTKTTFETVTLTLDIEPQDFSVPIKVDKPFLPKLKQAAVQIPALKQLLGNTGIAALDYPDVYLRNGFDGLDTAGQLINKGQVFLKAIGDAVKADFSKAVKDAGGLATPTFQLAGLSRLNGLVGGQPGTDALETFRRGEFNPAQFFDDEAKLLGGIRLKDLLKPFAIGDGSKIPKITTRSLFENGSPMPTALESVIEWKKKITPNDASAVPIFIADSDPDPDRGTQLALKAIVHTSLIGDRHVTQQIECTLQNFSISLIRPALEFVTVSFRQMVYRSQTGEKPKVSLDFGGVTFSEKLNFVREMGSLFNPGGKGPRINLDGLGLLAGYNFPFPTLTMGAFSLQNLSLYVGFRIPFDGRPLRLDLGVGERRNPFLVTVGIFGGGGYFLLGLEATGNRGVVALEIGIEFGGNFILEIPGLAVGHVYLLAGINYTLERTPEGNKASVTGYVRCGGELRVLGIITVSVTFYMGLTYNDADRSFTGRASVTVEIDIAFFSISVELSIERKFGGGGNAFLRGSRHVELASVALSPGMLAQQPPSHSVSELLPKGDWEDYCAAFA